MSNLISLYSQSPEQSFIIFSLLPVFFHLWKIDLNINVYIIDLNINVYIIDLNINAYIFQYLSKQRALSNLEDMSVRYHKVVDCRISGPSIIKL